MIIYKSDILVLCSYMITYINIHIHIEKNDVK